MKDLPENVAPYKRTPTFLADSIPKGLLKAHQTKAGTWGKIVILEGKLRYRILQPTVSEVLLSPETFGVVEPTILHEIAPVGDVSFYVEFYKCED
jgi:tellurite resistance-related uncharacterized protein